VAREGVPEAVVGQVGQVQQVLADLLEVRALIPRFLVLLQLTAQVALVVDHLVAESHHLLNQQILVMVEQEPGMQQVVQVVPE
jgi:hypothetical protein